MSLLLPLQLVVNGVTVGSLLALVALGVALIFGVMRVVNFAHGEFVTLGAFVTFFLVTGAGVSPLLAVPVAFVLGAALGALVQYLVLSRTPGRPELEVLMITYALSIIGFGLFSSAFGGDFRSYSQGPSGNLDLFGVVVGWRAVTGFLFCLVLGGGVILLMRRARFGLALRAVSQNRDAAAASGIDVPRSEMIAFSLAVGLAAAAGALVSLTATVSPGLGRDWLLDAFVVVVLGGLGSITGAVLAAVAIGVLHSFASFYLDDTWARFIVYLLLYATLLLRPRGLLGRAGA